MKVSYEKDRSHRPAYLKTTMALYPFDLGDLLVGALLEELMEPLEHHRRGIVESEKAASMATKHPGFKAEEVA